MANDEKQRVDEIDAIFAADPNATVVEGEQQVWLLTGKGLEAAEAALGRRDSGDARPVGQDDEVGASRR